MLESTFRGGVCSGESTLGGVCSGGVSALKECLLPGGVSAPGGVSVPRGVSAPGGCLLLRGCLLLGGCLLWETPPVDRITDTSKNITIQISIWTMSTEIFGTTECFKIKTCTIQAMIHWLVINYRKTRRVDIRSFNMVIRAVFCTYYLFLLVNVTEFIDSIKVYILSKQIQ